MSYRLPEQRRQFTDVATKSHISVDNGSISRMSIPCLYKEGFFLGGDWGRMMHDHIGWPSPDNPDKSCQLPSRRYGRIIALNEVDLLGEGYESVRVSMLNPPNGLTMTAEIDYNIIVLTIVAMCQSAQEEDIDVPFAIYAIGNSTGYPSEQSVALRDVVTKGILHIIAGPIG